MTDTSNSSAGGLAVRFWGVRGSAAMGGPANALYGSHTTCLEVTAAGRRIIVDAGTGIVPFGLSLDAAAGDHFDLLLTHLHHDHVIGLMLFAPLFVKGVTMDIYCGNLGGASAEEPLRRLFTPPLFPLAFDALPSSISFHGFTAGETIRLGDLDVHTCPLNHPDGATGYRFDTGSASLAILTDTEHEGEHAGDAADPQASLIAFCRDTDLIVYDATFDDSDYPRYRGWGHSTWEAGAALARAADAGALACMHHAPEYDDARLADMEARLRKDFASGFFAREGQHLNLVRGRAPHRVDGNAGP